MTTCVAIVQVGRGGIQPESFTLEYVVVLLMAETCCWAIAGQEVPEVFFPGVTLPTKAVLDDVLWHVGQEQKNTSAYLCRASCLFC